MFKVIRNNVLGPLLTRVGTLVGSGLSGMGYAQSDMDIVLAAMPIIFGVLIDLVTRKLAQ